jgi:hypothetical protein
MKSSRAINHVSWFKITDVSGTIYVSIIRDMMIGTEMVPETSVVFYQLARLIASEDFIKFIAVIFCNILWITFRASLSVHLLLIMVHFWSVSCRLIRYLGMIQPP